MSLRSSFLALVLVAGAAALIPTAAEGQIRASEPGMVMQTIDGTVVTIEYYRPRTRGRAKLFGHDAVVWEHIWTPGANYATTIEFQKPITIDGVPVEPGKYSLWMEMSEAEFLPETLIIEPEVLIFHTTPPETREEQVHIPVSFEDGYEFTDVLTWQFEEIRHDGGVLALRWGTHRMAFDIGVEPSMRYVVTEEEAAPMIGMWELGPPPGAPAGAMPEGMLPPTFDVSLLDDGMLGADLEGFPPPDGAFMNSVDLRLIPFADGIFKPAEFYDGAVQEIWEAFLELEYEGDEVVGWVVRDEVTDQIFMAARRRGG